MIPATAKRFYMSSKGTINSNLSLGIPPSSARVSCSVLDNKETFVQFSSDSGTNELKNAYITTAYRYRNLKLAEWLDTSLNSSHDDINKTVRRLRYCSSMSLVETNHDNSNPSILTTSKSCKSSHCAICSRSRSAKISSRLIDAITDKENEQLFKGKYYYFLTLTVKHDANTRTGIYFKEFCKYTKQLYRSELFKKYFPYSSKSKKSGWMTAYETTLNKGGYHTHAHILICGPRLNSKVATVQNEIRNKWKKITKDSEVIRLDLLKVKNASGQIDKDKLHRTVAELVKYGTKTGSFTNWTMKEANMYSNWIVETKGKNFITCSGLFRGLGLTGTKSKYDKKVEALETIENHKYFIGKTSQLIYNHSPALKHPRAQKVAVKNISMNAAKGFHDVSDIAEQMLAYSRCGLDENELDRFLKKIWIDGERSIDEFEIKPGEMNKEGMITQYKIFNTEPTKETTNLLSNW